MSWLSSLVRRSATRPARQMTGRDVGGAEGDFRFDAAGTARAFAPVIGAAIGGGLGGLGGGSSAAGAVNAEPGGGSRWRSIADAIIKYGGAAGDAYGAYSDERRASDLHGMRMDEFRRLAPLREAGMRGLMDTSRPDASAVFQEPQQRYRKVNVGSRG